ncbi:MAG TPA: ABC transporter substrate-binding protein [Nitrolancea sp.]
MGERDRVRAFGVRMSRRGFLGASIAGGSVLLGSLLSACGGGSDSTATSGASSTQASGGAQSTTTSTSSASPVAGAATASASGGATAASGGGTVKKGGTFSNFAAASPPSLDPFPSGSQGQSEFSAFSYSRLYMLKSGPGVPKGSLAVVPDAAAKTEVSQDGLTYTTTLRDNVVFHPPLSRKMTADDVVFSWNRLNGKTPGSTASDRIQNLAAIKDVTSTDNLTVVFTLSTAYPFFLQRLADAKAMFLMPKETGSDFNPAEKVVGSGPWILTKHTPNSSSEFKRHPDWHLGPDLPYFDSITTNVIPEYATQLSQFLAGNIDWIIVQSSDLKRVQDSVKGVQIYESPPYPLSVLNFSANTPQWKDVRYRHAVSMALDRDAMLDAAYGLKDLENQGIKVTRFWHNYVPAAFSEYWLDPKGTEITPEAAGYFKHDPEKAKSLVKEAGGGFSTELHYAAANSRYGDPYRIMSELIIEYLRDIGFDVKGVEEDYNSTFIPNTGKGKFDGLMWIPQTRTDPFAYYQTQYLNPKHGIYGQWKDDDLTQKMLAIQSLTDDAELTKQIKDVQNLLAEKMYVIPMQFGAASAYYAYQPWVQNSTVYQSFAQGWPSEDLPYYWSNK